MASPVIDCEDPKLHKVASFLVLSSKVEHFAAVLLRGIDPGAGRFIVGLREERPSIKPSEIAFKVMYERCDKKATTEEDIAKALDEVGEFGVARKLRMGFTEVAQSKSSRDSADAAVVDTNHSTKHSSLLMETAETCFRALSYECNISQVCQSLGFEGSNLSDMLKDAVDNFALEWFKCELNGACTSRVPTLEALKVPISKCFILEIRRATNCLARRNVFVTPLKVLAQTLADRMIDQLKEATKRKASAAGAWDFFGRLLNPLKMLPGQYQIGSSICLRGTLHGCGEMLDAIYNSVIEVTESKSVKITCKISIKSVTIDLETLEFLLGLNKGQLKDAVKWNNPNLERFCQVE